MSRVSRHDFDHGLIRAWSGPHEGMFVLLSGGLEAMFDSPCYLVTLLPCYLFTATFLSHFPNIDKKSLKS